ncbi:MAG: hypothetical protein N3E52_05970, partial [Candidatus Bathyarchaeota archaeon]|nr:hypothetical protein [Candidatus Bathyarchaeota archaeon]
MSKKFMEKLQSTKKLLEALKGFIEGFSRKTEKSLEQEHKMFLGKPLSIAYQLIGHKAERFLPLFKDLDRTLQKASLKINFRAYISLTILSSLSTAFATATILTIVPVSY